MANGDSDTGGEEARTPKDEKMDIDEPGSGAGGRSTRGELSAVTIFLLCVILIQYSKAFVKLRPRDSFSNRMYLHQDKHATHLVTYNPLNQLPRPTQVTIMRLRIQTVHLSPSRTTNRDLQCLLLYDQF